MKPTVPLKYCSIAFAVLWVGSMVWWNEIHQPANIVILSVCGAVAGYFWYLGMRWSFRRVGMVQPDGATPGADRSAS
jgi:hypothetical protein